MALFANNSVYAQSLLLIGEAIVGFIFLFALVGFVLLVFLGKSCQARWPLRCGDAIRGHILISLLAVMLLFSMLVWAVLAGFDQIPAYGAAILSAFTGLVIISVGNLYHTRQSIGDYRYTNANECGCCTGSASRLGELSYSPTDSPRKRNNSGKGDTCEMLVVQGSPTQPPLFVSDASSAAGGASNKNSRAGQSSSATGNHRGSNGKLSPIKLFFQDLIDAIVKHRERWVLLAVVACIYILLSGVAIALLQGICWCSNPKEMTTWISRKSDTKFCHEDQFCHLYALLGVNSTRMRLVGHVVTADGRAPKSTFAKVCPISRVGSTYTSSDPCSSPEWTVAGKVLDHAHISEDRRYLSHISLIGLESLTYYRATVSFTLSSGAVTSRSIMFRTTPAADDRNATVRFISGGDMHSSQSGKDGLREALAIEPLPDFIHIGGDISYSNNMRYCYLRVDFGLDVFTSLRTSMGVSIPFVFLVGNHESGGYGVDDFNNLYFHQQYFANFDTDEDPPNLAVTHHKHMLSGSVGLVCLDSDGMMSIPSQNGYLRDSLSWIYDGWRPPGEPGADPSANDPLPPSAARLALVSYHNPAYPSLRKFSNSQSARVRENWCPILDRYKVPLVFEFHDHAYKRSWPIRGNTVQTVGKGTVYIGDGGLGLDRDVDKDDADDSYLEKKLLQHNIQIVTVTPEKEIRVRSFGDNYEFLDETKVYKMTQ